MGIIFPLTMTYTPITKPPGRSAATNKRYWIILKELREKYLVALTVFIEDIIQTDPSSQDLRKAIVLHALLRSAPKDQGFPCYIAILVGAERQLSAWLG